MRLTPENLKCEIRTVELNVASGAEQQLLLELCGQATTPNQRS